MIFETSPREKEKVLYFRDRHYKCGKGMTYSFTDGGGIGIMVKVKCNGCGAETDATDYKCW